MLPLGSFAHSLASPSEVATALVGVLSSLDPDRGASYQLRLRDIPPTHRADLKKLTNRVVKDLNKHCPPFSYCGHHQTDESMWGVWIDLGMLHRAEEQGRLIQASTHPIKTRATYVLEIDERGARLFKKHGWQKVWETS